MNNLNKEIGMRLKTIRTIFNEGKKLSASQFGYLVEESEDNIRNYEQGRAGVPVRLLYNLYQRGINPVFIIAGEGNRFAINEAGRLFKEKIESRSTVVRQSTVAGNVEIISSAVQHEQQYKKEILTPIYKVAAGKIEYKKKDKSGRKQKSEP